MRILAFALLIAAAPMSASAAPDGVATEAYLKRQLRQEPDDRVAMVNLARVYLASGRTERAQRLYRGLLGLENVQLERAGGAAVWSHRLATDALAAPVRSRVQLSSR